MDFLYERAFYMKDFFIRSINMIIAPPFFHFLSSSTEDLPRKNHHSFHLLLPDNLCTTLSARIYYIL
nr:MAG TPA: hypothetical protein [Caudoviricetes sp.]